MTKPLSWPQWWCYVLAFPVALWIVGTALGVVVERLIALGAQ